MERIQFNGRNSAILGAAGGLAVGTGLGYWLGRKRLAAAFEEQFQKELEAFNAKLDSEVSDLRGAYEDTIDTLEQHYERETLELKEYRERHNVGAGPVLDEVPADDADQGGDPDDGEASVGIADSQYTDDDLVESGFVDREHLADHEVGAEPQPVSDTGLEPDIDKSRPYIISLEDFCEPPAGFQQLTITYYAGDKVLVDDKDIPIENVGKTTGPLSPLSFGGVSQDPHLMFVRNHLLDCDFEVVLNAGSYADIILNYGRPGART